MFHKGRTNAYSPRTEFTPGDRVEFCPATPRSK